MCDLSNDNYCVTYSLLISFVLTYVLNNIIKCFYHLYSFIFHYVRCDILCIQN